MATGSIIRVKGGDAAARAAFRERLRWRLVRDPDAPDYEEAHTGEALEYRLAAGAGLPFPSLVEASREFGYLRVEAEWPAAGGAKAGRVAFEGGVIVEKVDLAPDAPA